MMALFADRPLKRKLPLLILAGVFGSILLMAVAAVSIKKLDDWGVFTAIAEWFHSEPSAISTSTPGQEMAISSRSKADSEQFQTAGTAERKVRTLSEKKDIVRPSGMGMYFNPNAPTNNGDPLGFAINNWGHGTKVVTSYKLAALSGEEDCSRYIFGHRLPSWLFSYGEPHAIQIWIVGSNTPLYGFVCTGYDGGALFRVTYNNFDLK